MTKAELIKAISESAKITQKDVGIVLDSFMDTVKTSLSKGESIALVGFGTFEVATRAARRARNFKTKEIINVPASKTAKFKAGKGLKECVQEKPKSKKTK